MAYKIFPSLLSADILHLADEVDAVIQGGADMLHLDVMDNHYVPNLTLGPGVCLALHQYQPTIPIDVHLMVTPVDAVITAFAKAGAARISIHPDATIHLDRSLALIKEHHCQAGLVLNPATSLDALTWCTHHIDFVLVMTVNPGFGGQTLIPAVINKISQIHQLYPELPICVDGGITTANIASLAQAGATEFVAGSSIFGSPNYQANLQAMRQQLKNMP
jgi:ribulose-phosphate 3-epimerase